MFELERVEKGIVVHFSYFGERMFSTRPLMNEGEAYFYIKTLKERVPIAGTIGTLDNLFKEVV